MKTRILAVLACFALVACGDDDKTTSDGAGGGAVQVLKAQVEAALAVQVVVMAISPTVSIGRSVSGVMPMRPFVMCVTIRLRVKKMATYLAESVTKMKTVRPVSV